jgi:protein-serine/threonine kinase
MDPNNRPYLNLDGIDRPFGPPERAYPTTPSTFPQPSPAYQNQGPQQGYGQQAQGGYNGGGAGGYFMNNPYSPQYQQPMQGNYQAQQGLQAPQAAYGPRQGTYNINDGPNGLVHQFSHQNLGGAAAARQNNYGGRQQNPTQRPRTAGTASQAPPNSYLTQPMPAIAPQPDENARPERDSDKYSAKVKQCGGMTGEFVSNFFKENVTRARERNER